jgi:(heptosyl)LPS beta-1,4-glucosyltransferase
MTVSRATPTGPLPVSVVIITRDEARNIEACLRTLDGFDEVIVVDNGSRDGTPELAARFPNVRVLRTEWLGYGRTKQLGVEAARNEWILWLDADERMNPALGEEIARRVAGASASDVFTVARRNHFLGRWIRGCGWYPDRVTRLFHRGRAGFDEKAVHEGLRLDAAHVLVPLRAEIVHFSYVSLRQFCEKNVRYAFLAARERRRQGRKVTAVELLLRPPLEFLRSYVLRGGIRDGLHGVVISGGAAFYVLIRDAACLLGVPGDDFPE